ncbi:MAG: hypothetical protein HKN79_01665 [Flavobacteriales bacterium]|nr:hypothetical protein [Flavobacteriales bacterium]
MRWVLSVVLLFPLLAGAQQFVDVFKLDYRLSPENQYQDSAASSVDIADVHLGAFLPFEQDNGDYIILGANATWSTIDDLRVSSVGLIGGVRNTWRSDSDKWEYMTLLLPKINKDDGKILARDVQLGFFHLFYYKKRPGLRYKFGMYMNDDLFGLLLLPLFGADWQIDERTRLELTVPMSASIRRTLNDRWMAGFNYVGRKYSFNLSAANSYLEVADNTVTLFSDLYLTEKLVLNLQVGHSVLRAYDRYPIGEGVDLSFGAVDLNDDRKPLNSPLSQGIVLKPVLFYRFTSD